MAAHPPATLFKIKGAVNFVKYVEKLADEWIKYIGD
jgi:hypothetical protein